MPSLDPLTPLYLPLRPHSKLPPPHSSPSKPSVRTPKTTTFERPLIDHLAEFLEGRDGRTIRSIREASGVERAEVVGAVGERRFRATGSASAVGKARGLVDARLSQTPIRILLALRLSDERSSIQFIPCPSPSFPFLRALHLKTIVSLSPDLPQKSLQLWCEAHTVRFVHLGNRALPPPNPLGKSWRPISEELVKDALEFVLEAENQPCLFMDQSGIYETGIVCGCLRKLERWCLSAILAEYASFAGSKSRGSNEQFIELFDTELVTIPPVERRVPWFIGEGEGEVA